MLSHNLKFKVAHLEVSPTTFQKGILLGDHPDDPTFKKFLPCNNEFTEIDLARTF